MSESLVTIGTYWFIGDADVAKNALDAAGIESFVDDANIVRVNWFNANAVHGVKLRVRNVDALRAGEILNLQCESIEEIGEAHEEIVQADVCEMCGSADISRTPRALIFAGLAAALVAIGVAVGLTEAAFLGVIAVAIASVIAGRWHCSECGESWN